MPNAIIVSDVQNNLSVHRYAAALCQNMTDMVMGRPWLVSHFGMPSAVMGSFQTKRADIIDIHYHPNWKQDLDWGKLKSQLKKGAKLVVTCHEYSRISDEAQKVRVDKLLEEADHVIFTNAQDSNTALEGQVHLHGKSSIIPLGSILNIPDHYFADKPALSQESLPVIIGNFGVIQDYKGIKEHLIPAIRYVIENGLADKIQFHIVGKIDEEHSSYAEEVEREIRELQEQRPDAVIWEATREGLDHDRLRELAKECHFFFLTFKNGASPQSLSVLDAARAGVPVFSNKGRDTSDSMNAYCDFVDSPEELVSAIQRYQLNPESHAKRSKEISEAAKGQIIISASKTAELYESLSPSVKRAFE